MQVTKCDKCKKRIKEGDAHMNIYTFRLVPDDPFCDVEFCEECSELYLKKLLKDKVIKIKKKKK